MWNTTNYKGEPVTWYSQNEIDWLMKKLDDAYKCRDDCELHWEKEKKALKNKIEKYEHALINIKRFIQSWMPKTKSNQILKFDILQEIHSTESENK